MSTTAITTDQIRQLRAQSGAGMSACKAALVEAGGDLDAALAKLRIAGAAGVAKLSGRTTTTGLVAQRRTPSGMVMIALACETDFVAKSPRFAALAEVVLAAGAGAETDPGVQAAIQDASIALREKIELSVHELQGTFVEGYLHASSPDVPAQLGVLVAVRGDAAEDVLAQAARLTAQHIAAMRPRWKERGEVPPAALAAERAVATELAAATGKPEAVQARIVQGKLEAFYAETVLLDQPHVRELSRSVGAVLAEAGVEVEAFHLSSV